MAEINNSTNFVGATKPSSIDFDSYEEAIAAKRFVEVASNMQMRVAYDSNNNPEYVAYADRGVGTGGTWLIQKFTYTDGLATLRQIAYDTWDNRASASYS